MKSISLLVLAAIMTAAAPVAARCARPAALPSELPLLACPTRAVEPACRGCLPQDERVDLIYDGDPGAIGGGWIKALADAGWKVTVRPIAFSLPPRTGEAILFVEARDGHDVARTMVELGTAGQTVLAVTFSPG
jgi:hypothetical protein